METPLSHKDEENSDEENTSESYEEWRARILQNSLKT
jgi:hypothetical protein